ncbi:MAG: hypothetical protein MZW92_48730 [Comamonadaceae bacterium]|nr:hypothetical protein [Comamonadaceae bacterium]
MLIYLPFRLMRTVVPAGTQHCTSSHIADRRAAMTTATRFHGGRADESPG